MYNENKKLYAYVDKNNKIKALTTSKSEAKHLRENNAEVIKLNRDLASRIKDIPSDKELVNMCDVLMSMDEETEAVEIFHDRLVSIIETIDDFMVLLEYLKLPDNLKYQLEEFNFYLSNITESIGNNSDEDYGYTINMFSMFSDIIKEIRKE